MISIITACYNSESTIASTLKCIDSQTTQCEHIIVDGGSKDSTLDILKQHASPRRLVESGPDKGIYDAMNKGIARCSGDIIGILNADDFYPDPDVLTWVQSAFDDPFVDGCYGDLQYVDGTDTDKVHRNWVSGSYDVRKFYNGWMPPHPTFFVRRSVYERFGMFNLELGSAADYELMLRFLVRYQIKAAYIPKVIVKMRTGGVSNASVGNRLKANRMDRKAWEVNGLRPRVWTLWMKPMRKVGQFF